MVWCTPFKHFCKHLSLFSMALPPFLFLPPFALYSWAHVDACLSHPCPVLGTENHPDLQVVLSQDSFAESARLCWQNTLRLFLWAQTSTGSACTDSSYVGPLFCFVCMHWNTWHVSKSSCESAHLSHSDWGMPPLCTVPNNSEVVWHAWLCFLKLESPRSNNVL